MRSFLYVSALALAAAGVPAIVSAQDATVSGSATTTTDTAAPGAGISTRATPATPATPNPGAGEAATAATPGTPGPATPTQPAEKMPGHKMRGAKSGKGMGGMMDQQMDRRMDRDGMGADASASAGVKAYPVCTRKIQDSCRNPGGK